jgi:hypothetical protein
VTSTLDLTGGPGPAGGLTQPKSSDVLRGILRNNPGVKRFSVKRILASIGRDHIEASLMMFSIPAIVPVPRPRGVVAVPTGAIAYKMVAGHEHITLPGYILKKSVSRRSLAVAIHAILPILEAAEKVLKPRWSWVCHSISRRAIGLLVFLLAVAIASPVFGVNALHAISIFVISLGLAEKDGLAVMIGVVAGILSLAIVASSGVSARALQAKAKKWLRKIARKRGLRVSAHLLDMLGYERLASILSFEWSALLLLWDPEKRAAERAQRAAVQATPESPELGAQERDPRIAELEAPFPSPMPSLQPGLR